MQSDKYCVVRNAIQGDLVKLLQVQSQMLENIMCYENNTLPTLFSFNDRLVVQNSFSYYSSSFTESLLLMLQPLIEDHLKIKLLPSYSYIRIYYKNAALTKHLDKDSCEYSATICIKCHSDNPWDIYFENLDLSSTCITLNEGDMVIYKGNEIQHWRKLCPYDKHIQIMLHYVDKNGPYSKFKYNQRKMLGLK
jgi:hypothetical protein